MSLFFYAFTCNQFVAPEIHHITSLQYSVTRTRFWYKVCIWRVHSKDVDRRSSREELDSAVLKKKLRQLN